MNQLALDFNQPESRMRTKPYRHQLEEYNFHYEDPERALIWQMRTGKTKVILDSACRLFLENKIDTLLVVAPNGVHENWIDNECQKHMWDSVLWRAWYWDTSLKENPNYIKGLQQICNNQRILRIVSFSSATLANQLLAKKAIVMTIAKSVKGVLLVFDEATDFRNPGSKRTKWARAFSRRNQIKYRRLLTGTPLLNSLMHGYAQLELLRPKFFGYSRYDNFKARYGEYEKTYTGFDKLVGYKNIDEFKEKLETVSSFLNREDCPDLTNLIMITKDIELHPKQKEAISILMKNTNETVQDLPENDIRTKIAEIKKCFMKEQQIVSGFIGIKNEFDEVQYFQLMPHKENPKLIALIKEVVRTEEPVIIWCQFRYDIKLICKVLKLLKIPYRDYYGETTQAYKRYTRLHFNKGEIKVLVGQPQSAGLGLDLSIASKIIWYSHTYNAIVRNQANERATNMEKANIELIDFMAPPIDRIILKALELKSNISEYIAETRPDELLTELSLV